MTGLSGRHFVFDFLRGFVVVIDIFLVHVVVLGVGVVAGDRRRRGAVALPPCAAPEIQLVADPAKVNADAMGEGWFIKIRLDDPKQLDGLMDETAYQAFVGEQP